MSVKAHAVGSGSLSITVTMQEIVSGVLVIPPSDQSGDPNETLSYPFTVKNTGLGVESYSLEAVSAGNWDVNLPGGTTVGPLNPDQEAQVDVNVTVPANSLAAVQDVLSLTATSVADLSVSSSANVTTTVNQIAALSIRSPKNRRDRPGEIVTLRVQVRNLGNGEDSFELSAISSLVWEVNFPGGNTTGPLARRGRSTISLEVTIPAGAARGDSNIVTITATSQFDPSVSESSDTNVNSR